MKQITNRALRTSRIFWVLLVLCLILVPVPVQAGELTEQEVQAAVQTWVRHVTADAMPDAVIDRMEPHQVKGEAVAYIAHLSSGGFCLCGADDLVLPVYLYSPQGKYDSQNPNYQYILWEIETRLKYLRGGLEKSDSKVLQYQGALSERDAFWQELIVGRIPTIIEEKGVKAEPVIMELDLTSQWHQGSPYNDQCPNLTPGEDEHAVVGCVATAMTQLMYYWKWPNTGVGQNSKVYNRRGSTDWVYEHFAYDPNVKTNYGKSGQLEWISEGGGKLRMKGYWDYSLVLGAKRQKNDSAYTAAVHNLWDKLPQLPTTHTADFGATNYNWGILQDMHTDPPDDGDPEVAKLCYHAGIAVLMGWGVQGSSSNFGDNAVNALENNFRYDHDATSQYGSDIGKMTEDIQWLRALSMEGCSTDGCHAWVAYGYNKGTDPDREFLMNIGWGPDSSHVWYSCDSVPFPNKQWISFRIAPLNVVKFVGEVDPGDGSPDNPYEDIEEAIVDAPDGATLIFKAGSTNTFSGDPLVINRPFTLKGHNVIIQKQ
jgi:hypothetical protein